MVGISAAARRGCPAEARVDMAKKSTAENGLADRRSANPLPFELQKFEKPQVR